MAQYPGNSYVPLNTPAPVTAAPAVSQAEAWNEGLCGCFDDCGSCCLTYLAPSVQFGLNQEALENDSCCSQAVTYHILSGCCLGWAVHTGRRSLLRQKYNLKEEGMGDCLTVFLCPTLSIMQEAREIKSRSLPRSHPAVVINRAAPSVQTMTPHVASPPAYIPTQPTGQYASVNPVNNYAPQPSYNQYQPYTAPPQQIGQYGY